MVTGDHPKTAAAIAKEVGILSPDGKLPTDLVMAAKDFDACIDAQVSSLPPSLPPSPGSLLAALGPCGIRIRISPSIASFITPPLIFLPLKKLDGTKYLPRVVARCSPATKVKLIDALHRRGRVVAMTGTKGEREGARPGERERGRERKG
jgi:magnesium-transporting ATPase (P-type)